MRWLFLSLLALAACTSDDPAVVLEGADPVQTDGDLEPDATVQPDADLEPQRELTPDDMEPETDLAPDSESP
ncbi:hypothetical protein [Rubrivirga sp.]|uniref:hypothetical protein n=1 Tax=Rubrivirga sp. TaxID=1885344 RepID=UPI003C74BB68